MNEKNTIAIIPTKELWLQRQEVVRQEAWELHFECIEAAKEGLQTYRDNGGVLTISEIVRLAELGTELGQLASGLHTNKHEITGEGGGPIRIEMQEAIRKIYGLPVV